MRAIERKASSNVVNILYWNDARLVTGSDSDVIVDVLALSLGPHT